MFDSRTIPDTPRGKSFGFPLTASGVTISSMSGLELLVGIFIAFVGGATGGKSVDWAIQRWGSKRDRRREILANARTAAGRLADMSRPAADDRRAVDAMSDVAVSLPNEDWYICLRDDLTKETRKFIDGGPYEHGTSNSYLRTVAKTVLMEAARIEKSWSLR